LNNFDGRKPTKLWATNEAPVVMVMVNDDLRRIGAAGQECNYHCRQANQKHSHGSFSAGSSNQAPMLATIRRRLGT
jgi:hypothetical protein